MRTESCQNVRVLPAIGLLLSMNLPTFRPPSVPLLVSDPYFSVWSPSDKLTDSWPCHWTGATNALCGLVRIDGKAFRFSGTPNFDVPALEQTACRVEATQTHYKFRGGGVELSVDFMSPAFADDLDTMSSALGYVTLSWSGEGKHSVQAYVDVSGEWCVNSPDQRINAGRVKLAGREALRIGSQDQPILQKSGDNLRIDWGHLYLVGPKSAELAITSHEMCRRSFLKKGSLPDSDDLRLPRSASDDWLVLGTAFEVAKDAPASVLIAYDDLQSIQWIGRPVPAYWRRNGGRFEDKIVQALDSRAEWQSKANAFDAKLRQIAQQTGGEKYADLVCLSYRQAMGAHKIVADIDGKPMMFSKENFSNGCIGTVDVLYPAAPIFLMLNPELLEANLRPLFVYASLPRWKWPFAPHDLGTYPHANGQVYGGGERTEDDQMPVEECGNLLILAGALAEKGGSIDFLREYKPVLDKWAEYLLEKGMDPDLQLCTDDFAGHLAHNSNLSLKAIIALGAYAQLLPKLDPHAAARANEIHGKAEAMAKQWVEKAEDGDHFRLAFDAPGSWSQKYNLVWDRLLELGLFPKEVTEKEMAFYAKNLGRYGLPLDNRKGYTKLDWCVWTAWLTGSKAELEKFVDPLWQMANDSSSRVPLTDWFETGDARQVGFQARSVVGGIYLPMAFPSK